MQWITLRGVEWSLNKVLKTNAIHPKISDAFRTWRVRSVLTRNCLKMATKPWAGTTQITGVTVKNIPTCEIISPVYSRV